MTDNQERLQILMLGEALSRPGGIVTVEKATLLCAPDRLSFHHVPTLPADGPRGWIRKLWMFTTAIFLALFHLISHRVDIVHIHISVGASILRKCLLAQIAFLFNKPVVMHTHGGEFAKQFPALPKVMQTIVRRTFQRCSSVITLAETWRRFYVETLGIEPTRTVVLKNPVSLPATLPTPPETPPVRLLYLGMLSESKGAFDLLDALAHLAKSGPTGLHLTMAGHGQLTEAKKRVAAAGLEETVDLHGWIDTETRDALLAKTHVFVLPSHFEGLPMALLEAMSFAIAPIATPVGGIPDVLRDGSNGLLVPPGEPETLAEAIHRLASDHDFRRRLGEAARLSVEPYSADGYAETLVEIYQSVLEDGALVQA